MLSLALHYHNSGSRVHRYDEVKKVHEGVLFLLNKGGFLVDLINTGYPGS